MQNFIYFILHFYFNVYFFTCLIAVYFQLQPAQKSKKRKQVETFEDLSTYNASFQALVPLEKRLTDSKIEPSYGKTTKRKQKKKTETREEDAEDDDTDEVKDSGFFMDLKPTTKIINIPTEESDSDSSSSVTTDSDSVKPLPLQRLIAKKPQLEIRSQEKQLDIRNQDRGIEAHFRIIFMNKAYF